MSKHFRSFFMKESNFSWNLFMEDERKDRVIQSFKKNFLFEMSNSRFLEVK